MAAEFWHLPVCVASGGPHHRAYASMRPLNLRWTILPWMRADVCLYPTSPKCRAGIVTRCAVGRALPWARVMGLTRVRAAPPFATLLLCFLGGSGLFGFAAVPMTLLGGHLSSARTARLAFCLPATGVDADSAKFEAPQVNLVLLILLLGWLLWLDGLDLPRLTQALVLLSLYIDVLDSRLSSWPRRPPRALRPGVPLPGRASQAIPFLGTRSRLRSQENCRTQGSGWHLPPIVIFPRVFLTSDPWSPSHIRKASAGIRGSLVHRGTRRTARAKCALCAMRSPPYALHGSCSRRARVPSPAVAVWQTHSRYGRLWECELTPSPNSV